MDKKSAIPLIPGKMFWNAIKNYAAAHPGQVAAAKVLGGLGGGYAAGDLTASYIKNRQTGQATFGSPKDMYEKGSYLNTFNPLSSVMGGIDRIPESYVKLFPKTTEGRQAAHTTFKAGAVGLLAAGLVGGYRALQHYDEMDELEEADRPGKELASQLSTTFSGDLKPEKKTASGRVPNTGVLTWSNFFGTAMPLSAALLAASLAYRGTDNYFDKKRNAALDKSIASKEDAIKQLIATRARIAKGVGTQQEIADATSDLADKDVYTKDASLNKKALLGLNDLFQHFGAATAAVIIASALGSYAYTSASDENNIKYKAYKKGLQEYAKNKSGITPITIAPANAKGYFDYINGDKDLEEVSPRNQPEINSDDLNKPISISI